MYKTWILNKQKSYISFITWSRNYVQFLVHVLEGAKNEYNNAANMF